MGFSPGKLVRGFTAAVIGLNLIAGALPANAQQPSLNTDTERNEFLTGMVKEKTDGIRSVRDMKAAQPYVLDTPEKEFAHGNMKAVTDMQTDALLKKMGAFAKDVGVEPAYKDLTRKLDAIQDKDSVEGTYKIWGANTTFSWEANKAPVKAKRDAALKDPKNADIAKFLEGLKKTVPDYKIMNNGDPTDARAQFHAQAQVPTTGAQPAAPIVTTVPSGAAKAPTPLHRAAPVQSQPNAPTAPFTNFENPDLPGVFNVPIMQDFLNAGRILHKETGNANYLTAPEKLEAGVNKIKWDQRNPQTNKTTSVSGSLAVQAANNAAAMVVAYKQSGYYHCLTPQMRTRFEEVLAAPVKLGAVPVAPNHYLSPGKPLPDKILQVKPPQGPCRTP